MRIRSLLRLSFLLISFLLLGGTGFSFYALYSVQRDVQNIYEIRLRSTGFLLEADRDAYQSNLAGLHSIYATRKIKDIEENRDQVLQRFEKFEKLWNQTKGHKHPALTQFHDHYPAWSQKTDELIELLRAGKEDAAKDLYEGQYDREFATMRDALDQLTEASNKYA
ncbi:MAG: MCP four helix bundle domain-containing protein, partial [Leptospiraceae bacterium]|nr:MCP four helix bundle domain-containing protein [Leptospiraceae bacterium]